MTAPTAPPSFVRDRKLPPVAETAVASICMMLIGGVYLAAKLPGHPGLVLPVALVIAGGALTVAALGMLSRIRPFAWPTFFLVLRWGLLAYLIIAGILELVFIRDHTPGSTMAVLTVTLFVFAVDVPTILAFTVARFAEPVGGDTGTGEA
jgi:hypothetical protein